METKYQFVWFNILSLFRIWDILTSISLLLTSSDLFFAMSGNGMLESMLEPHLKAYGAGTVGVGMAFAIFGSCYVLGNIIFQKVSIIKSDPSKYPDFVQMLEEGMWYSN